MSVKKTVIRELAKAGWSGYLDAGALDALMDYISNRGETYDPLLEVLNAMKSSGFQRKKINRSMMEDVLSKLQGGASTKESLEVVNVFRVPKMSYEPVKRMMYAGPKQPQLFADAQAKPQMYMDRLYLVLQRMRRNKLFQQQEQLLPHSNAGHKSQLTETKALLGAVGESRIVMGVISQLEEGRYYLQDLSGAIPMDLTNAKTTSGLFTEKCIVVAQGQLHPDGIFHVHALGFPPVESRHEMPPSLTRLNFFGGRQLSTEEENAAMGRVVAEREHERIVVMSDVHLDQPRVLKHLHTIFRGFSDADALPEVFVLMGNFCSKNCSGGTHDYAAVREGFAALAQVLAQYPEVREKCRFVLVPGPGDVGAGGLLPQPPLPDFLVEPLKTMVPDLILGTNPCRLRYEYVQMVLFRYDLLKRMRQRCLLPPKGDDTPESLFTQLAVTVLQQSHLCPLPLEVQPVWWECDHALHVYPLPRFVMLADSSPQAHINHSDTAVLNPGSFAKGFFAACVPFQVTDNVELCEVPELDNSQSQPH